MVRTLFIALIAFGLGTSTMVLAQQDDAPSTAQEDEDDTRTNIDPRGVSMDEALDPTARSVEDDAQDFFNSFETQEIDENLLDEFDGEDPLAEGDDPLLADDLLNEDTEDQPQDQITDDGVFEGGLVNDTPAVPGQDEEGAEPSSDPEMGDVTEPFLDRNFGAERREADNSPNRFVQVDGERPVYTEEEALLLGPIPNGEGISRVATIRGLDKITARVRDVEVPVGRPVMFERFEILVQACSQRPPEETPETTAFIQITEHRLDGRLETVFSGWMFASTPAMNPVDHPVYDVWLIDCKTL